MSFLPFGEASPMRVSLTSRKFFPVHKSCWINLLTPRVVSTDEEVAYQLAVSKKNHEEYGDFLEKEGTIISQSELARRLDMYGSSCWASWYGDHWGTRWIGEGTKIVDESPTHLTLTYDGNGSMPHALYEYFESQGAKVLGGVVIEDGRVQTYGDDTGGFFTYFDIVGEQITIRGNDDG